MRWAYVYKLYMSFFYEIKRLGVILAGDFRQLPGLHPTWWRPHADAIMNVYQ